MVQEIIFFLGFILSGAVLPHLFRDTDFMYTPVVCATCAGMISQYFIF